MAQLRFDNQVVVVTGAGGGLGKAYAVFFASRGAKVVVNDLGGSGHGEGRGNTLADKVVAEIKSAGGQAVADYNNVIEGQKIIETAIQAYGRIDVLINNAGILRDISFKNMTDHDWDLIMAVHVEGAYKCARAAWPYFRKQRYGRILNTSSAAGLFGNFGQSNYASAKLALVGFTETLALEGKKYNINANVIAPTAASRLTATVMTDALLAALDPAWVVPVVAVLVDKNSQETGSVFEIGGGRVAKYRWQRSKGAIFKCDENFTAGALLQNWSQVNDFSKAEYPTGPMDMQDIASRSQSSKPNPRTDNLDFTGKVVLVTGGAAGLGRSYSLAFAKLGASVAVNDLASPDQVVEEITRAGGKAIGIQASVLEGALLVKKTVEAFGRIDIVINNAGILRDKAFVNMDDRSWKEVQDIHLRATYKITQAAWPLFLKQKSGKVINTTSTTGIYGNFGQTNYASAKAGVLGLARTLANEGAKHNIHVNTIAPTAVTNMSRSVMPEEATMLFHPDYVVPLVLLLCSDKIPNPSGNLYEVGGGRVSRTRWERSGGHSFPVTANITPEDVLNKWTAITRFDEHADHPWSPEEGAVKIMANINMKNTNTARDKGKSSNSDALAVIKSTIEGSPLVSNFSYTQRDVVLYNLGIGARYDQLPFVFEDDPNFQLLPTFGSTMTYYSRATEILPSLVPNFSMTRVLHGEQYLEIRKFPIPTAANLVSETRILEVIDKGAAAVVRYSMTTIDKDTKQEVFYNESVMFARGSGGFGGAKKGADRGASTAPNSPPARKPDHVTEEHIPIGQAALYRLSGDYNPLHIDPKFAAAGGFPGPILHGLCFFGMAGKAVFEQFGAFKSMKVRFAGTVNPGQTLVTEMWKEGNKVIFQTKVKETGKLALAAAAVELLNNSGSKL